CRAVVHRPWLRTFCKTRRTWSGRVRALTHRDSWASSRTIFSVPAEISDERLAIKTCPGGADGSGTFLMFSFPSRIFCRTWYIHFLATRRILVDELRGPELDGQHGPLQHVEVLASRLTSLAGFDEP